MISRFLGVDNSEVSQPIGRVRILPIPYDLTTSYRPGARFGPNAILDASSQLEFFDDEIEWDATQYLHFLVEEEILPEASSPEAMMKEIGQIAAPLLSPESFLFSLGGEHSISFPLIEAYFNQYPDLHVIQIDAHGDLRDSWNGSPYSHACVMRRVIELGVDLTQIGIRNLSQEGFEFIANQPSSIQTWRAKQLKEKENFNQLLDYLRDGISSPVYLTLDVDGLDPSVIPTTGTPEPGGLTWYETVEIIRTICFNNNLVGADLVELAPGSSLNYGDFAAAKLVYKIISYNFYRKWKLQKGVFNSS